MKQPQKFLHLTILKNFSMSHSISLNIIPMGANESWNHLNQK